MEISRLSYRSTGYFDPVAIDFAEGKENLRKYYGLPPQLSSLTEAVNQKSKEPIDREGLYDLLARQYKGIVPHPAAQKNMNALKEENTFCCVTAHQLNIFTGPLYVVYKALFIIKLCRIYSENSSQHQFVPVFWLGSEDHDFEEINHVHLFGKTYEWTDRQGGACGHYDPSSLGEVLSGISEVLGTGETADELRKIFSSSYMEQPTLAGATRSLLNALFGRYGLVVVDGDDKTLKAQCADIILDELMNQSSRKIITDSMHDFPYEQQAFAREINLFYLGDQFRERIIPENDGFAVNHTDVRFTKEEMIREVQEHPERFSPNVLLRPVFQQKVLPAVAWTGGGGEVAYWLQLKSLFAHHKIAYPIIFLRNSILWIDENTAKKLDKLGITTAEIFGNEEELVKNYVVRNAPADLSLSAQKEALKNLFFDILSSALSIDPDLEKTVLAEQQNTMNSLEKLSAKLIKGQKSREDGSIPQIRSIKAKLFPEGKLQERYLNFIPWYLKYGSRYFDILLETIDPFCNEFIVISE